MSVRVWGLVVVAAPLWAGTAVAQTDMAAMTQDSAANQLGVLEYCQSQGYVDGSAALAQKGVISRLPAYTGSTAAAEAAGKSGNIVGNGQSYPIADMAEKGHTTPAAMCQQMAANVKQVAASNASAFGPGGMPKMPSGMPMMPGGMPAMPGGMPTMPGGMPAMPGTPQPR